MPVGEDMVWHLATDRLLRPALLVLALLVALPARAQAPDGDPLGQKEGFNKGGRTSFQFLKIGLGARQVALGEAGIALVRDVNSVFWNPAGIAGIGRFEASFSYNRWLADMNYVSGAVGGRWPGVGVVAASVASLDYGEIPEALTSRDGDARTGSTFSGGDLMAGLYLAREFTDRLSIGIGAKFLRESLFNYAVNTYAFDVGTNYDMGFKGLRLAMAVQNYGGAVSWLAEEQTDRPDGYDLPLTFRIGVSTTVVGAADAFVSAGPAHRLTLSAEAINTNDFSERLHVGAEYAFSDLLTLRGGYRMNYEEGNWAAGVGLNPSFSGMQLRIDYAYVAYEFLTAPHRFTVSLAF
jgi:hypothetical protein